MKHVDMPTGIAWFTEETYAETKRIAADPDVFEAPYEDWLARAEKKMTQLKEKGLDVRRVLVNVKSYCEWCDKNRRPKDSRSRADYAARILKTGGLF